MRAIAPDATTLPGLSHSELVRYARHLILPEVGADGQRKLKAGRVVLVGAGGLGSPAALYLAAAGVGTIGLVDFDAVDETNLQRQVLHGTSQLGRPKLESARARLADLNPHVTVETHDARLTSVNALEILGRYDVVIDGSDNFPTRYLVNDACVLLGRPDVYGAVLRFDGQASVFATPEGPCYRCLFAEPPPAHLVPSCAEGGVLGVLPGVIGAIQATEAIKLLLGAGRTLIGRLLLFDALGLTFRELAITKDPACPVCGPRPTVTALIDYEAFCGVGAAPQPGDLEVEPRALQAELDAGADVFLLDVREPFEHAIARLDGATLIPLGELPARLAEVPPHADVVALCHHGPRSARAVDLLRGAGFRRVRNLRGGIDRWSRDVDPGMPRY